MTEAMTVEAMTVRPPMPRTSPGVAVPPGACDCHTHVFGPHARFPLWDGRSYTPPQASIDDLLRVHTALGMERVVIVHPSIYGTDNRVTLDALRVLGPRARGVAVVNDGVDGETLAALEAGGMRGVRINLRTTEEPPPDEAEALVRRMAEAVAPFDWHIQLFVRLALIERMAGLLDRLPVRVSLDHFGGAQAADGADASGVDVLCDLLRGGNVFLKLSGGHRVAHGANDPALDPLARRLIAANPDRLVWGTDWPHPGAFVAGMKQGDVDPLHDIDDGASLAALARWAGDADTLARILVHNPAALYGFDAGIA